MNLEDHLGDIIRKARAMSNVSTAAAAQAAGLTEAELTALEDSGQVAKKTDFTKLAPLIGLHPQKLQSIAEGWLPSEKHLSKWPELRPLATAAEGITVNCYLVWDEISREAALFDTGWMQPRPWICFQKISSSYGICFSRTRTRTISPE